VAAEALLAAVEVPGVRFGEPVAAAGAVPDAAVEVLALRFEGLALRFEVQDAVAAVKLAAPCAVVRAAGPRALQVPAVGVAGA
jgi:hypothetical protein